MTITLDPILDRYEVDRAHARHVADLALALFDGSERLHGLPARARELVEVGALLHNVGLHIDERKHHTVGRDIVLNTAIEGLDDDERAVVACLVAFHRKKVLPEAESAFLRLGKKDQEAALQLAAIVRVADGLDYSQSQTTAIEALELNGDEVQLTLSGPHAADDGARAEAKANLWKKVFGAPISLTARPVEQEATTPAVQVVSVATSEVPTGDAVLVGVDGAPLTAAPTPPATAPWKLQPEDTLAEAARKVLRRYFQKLLSQEAEVRQSEDPEGVHQMRVATRRLRATLQALGPAIDPEQAGRFRRQIRTIASELGAVRDRDVFLLHVEEYAKGEGAVPLDQLAPLTDALAKDQAAAKARLLRKLDGRRYERFKRAFASFITSSDDQTAEGANGPVPRIRYAAGSAIWRAYEQLRAYETLVPLGKALDAEQDMTRLHEMRIAGKHFRYTLELFGEALGPRVEEVLAPLIDLQEHLGALQDIEVAAAYVANLPSANGSNAALEQYVQARHADRDRLLAELPARWSKVGSATYRRRLMEVIVKL